MWLFILGLVYILFALREDSGAWLSRGRGYKASPTQDRKLAAFPGACPSVWLGRTASAEAQLLGQGGRLSKPGADSGPSGETGEVHR